MLNFLETAPALLVALVQTVSLVALGILFGTLEQTTDVEFKAYGLDDGAFRAISTRTWTLIIGTATVVGVALFIGDLFYESVLTNWSMLLVVVIVEAIYFAWVGKLGGRIREMVTGVCLLTATWPALCRLSVNLRNYGQMETVWPVQLLVLASTILYVAIVIARVYLDETNESSTERG